MKKQLKWMLPAAALLAGCNGGDDLSVSEIAAGTAYRQSAVEEQQAYITALFYSNTAAANAAALMDAREALDIYRRAWGNFREAYQDSGDDAWRASFAEVDAYLNTAAQGLDSATGQLGLGQPTVSLLATHDALEEVRVVLMEMRAHHGIPDFMDALTTFHRAMEPLAITAGGLSNATAVTAEVAAALAGYLVPLQAAWTVLTGHSIDPARYGFSTAKMAYINQAISQGGNNLAALGGALAAANAGATMSGAKQVKPLFVKLFLSFGDFITPFAADMAAAERAYIPALFYTNNAAATPEQVALAKQHLAAFAQKWQGFAGHYTAAAGALGWGPYFTTVQDNIAAATQVLASSPANMVPAHNALEIVRNTLAEWRGDFENYPFVMDAATAYHNAMEPIALTVKDVAGAEALSAAQIAAIDEALPATQQMLDALAAALKDMDPRPFGFNSAKMDSLNVSVSSQQVNLDTLESALAQGDQAAILSAAQQVKPGFVALFKSFGAF